MIEYIIEYIKKNHLALLVIVWLVVVGLFGVGTKTIIQQIGEAPSLGNSTDRTTITNPWTFTEDVTFSGAGTNLTITATTTSGAVGTVSYQTRGGIDYAYAEINSAATSSTWCSIPNPFGAATTSFTKIGTQVTSGYGAAWTYSWGTSTTNLGTSSPAIVLDRAVAAGAQDTAFWLPSSATTTSRVLPGIDSPTGVSNWILGPSEFLNMRIATATAGQNYPSGTCAAEFWKN